MLPLSDVETELNDLDELNDVAEHTTRKNDIDELYELVDVEDNIYSRSKLFDNIWIFFSRSSKIFAIDAARVGVLKITKENCIFFFHRLLSLFN